MNAKDAEALIDRRFSIERLNKTYIGLDENVKLYVDMHLTPYMGKIAILCRSAKRKSLISKTKIIKGGIVKILLTPYDDWLSVSHTDDIKKYIPEFDLTN